jgi:hypothetical protein
LRADLTAACTIDCYDRESRKRISKYLDEVDAELKTKQGEPPSSNAKDGGWREQSCQAIDQYSPRDKQMQGALRHQPGFGRWSD